jgi:hypothetical protein
MSISIRVFIPETGVKTQLIYNDVQNIREWAMKHSSPENTVRINSRKHTKTQVVFLQEALRIFGTWKNIIIH